MTIKHTIWSAAVAVALFAAAATVPAVRADDKATTQPTSQPAAAANTKCPLTGEDIDAKVTTVYNGKTYAFCCADCVAKFKSDPAKYAAKAK